jgi:hypothetical protein
MSYAAMTKRAAGYVVPASEYNQFIDNDDALLALMSRSGLSLYSTSVAVDINATETTILTYSVPAGELGTADILNVVCRGTYSAGGASGKNATFKLKYGGTTFFTLTSADWRDEAGTGMWEAKFTLAADASASAQNGWGFVQGMLSDASYTWGCCGYGTATEASAGALNLVVTASKIAGASFTFEAGWITAI